MARLNWLGNGVGWTVAAAIASMALAAGGAQLAASQPTPQVVYAQQGWSDADRAAFYTTSQGSHLMPYAWFKAMRRLDVDQPFIGDQLQRYGYLRDDRFNVDGMPVGFVVDTRSAPAEVGMTCAACHTGQIEYDQGGVTHALRIDGAPAKADFQQFLLDLRAAANATLTQPARFDAFAAAVLADEYPGGPPAGAVQLLRSDLIAWVAQFGEFMDKSLPAHAWGPGRLDAFGMIFNRVAARDLGVETNFQVADAPVRYPFLWNATLQDHTQWTGSVPNGLYIEGMARNTGEVLGVFADFKPSATPLGFITLVDYSQNSADFAGLQTLEEKVATLQPPPWPADLFGQPDPGLVAQGKTLFHDNCGRCHEERPSPSLAGAWDTEVYPEANTDPKVALNAARISSSGMYQGASLLSPGGGRFAGTAPTTDILRASVVGAVAAGAAKPSPDNGVWRALSKDANRLNAAGANANPFAASLETAGSSGTAIQGELSQIYVKRPAQQSGAAYEARVLHGVWAAAPYLHNGSVPNLWELLTPPKDRKPSFMVGSRVYDPKLVGFAADQSPSRNGAFVADPANANGNGNQGHDFGTGLSEADRRALIEYLKTL
jgi:hypothetical protein